MVQKNSFLSKKLTYKLLIVNDKSEDDDNKNNDT